MSNTQLIPLLLNLIAAVFGACGQYLYKTGASRLHEVAIYKNWQIVTGILAFCCVMVLFVTAFRLGGKLSVVYPAYATTFIWSTIIASRVEHEPVNLMQILGILVIVTGVSMIGFFSAPSPLR